MTNVLLVTCAAVPDGEDGGHLLVEEFAARGVEARWVAWDDPSVCWSGAELVAVRSAWDYEHRRGEFLAWARSVEATTSLVNGSRVFEWNTDKAYLLDLVQAGVLVVPTIVVDEQGELASAVASFGRSVVKPRVGASGLGVVVFDGQAGGSVDLDESRLHPGPWIVQPVVESIHSEGETSVFVLGGEVVSAVLKVPGAGEIRVHEEYGGHSTRGEVTEEASDLARQTVWTAERLLNVSLPYARVDLMRLADGRLAVGELEVTEPGLYLDIVPENAPAFADAMVGLL